MVSLRAQAGEGLPPLRVAVDGWLTDSDDAATAAVTAALDAAATYLDRRGDDRASLEAGARGLAFTLARCAAAALLARQATWSARTGERRPEAALRRFVSHGLNRLIAPDAEDTGLLLG
jgi:hypothetical protein